MNPDVTEEIDDLTARAQAAIRSVPKAADEYTPPWLDKMAAEAWLEAQRVLKSKRRIKELRRYAENPVSFGREILGEDYTEGVIKVMHSVRDNPVTIARSANGVGKSHGAARIATWWFCCFEDAQVYITAAPPLENLKRILWGQVMSVVERKPDLFYGFKLRSLKIIRDSQSFMDGVAIPTSGTSQEREAKFSGKHSPHLLFIVDEGDAVPDEVYKGIESCMSGGMARLLVMFNPRIQYGPVYMKESERQANVVRLSAFEHPNVVTGRDVFPGAVTRQTVVRRINEWTRELAPDEKIEDDCFQVPEFLEKVSGVGLDGREYPPLPAGYRKIKEAAFSYMVLGEYPPLGSSQLISEVWINNARSRWDAYVSTHGEMPPQGTRPILGIDIAELGSDSNVLCARYGGYVSRLKTWGNIDVDESATKGLNLYRDLNAEIAFICATGVGAGVAPSMSRQGRHDPNKVRAIGIKVAEKPLNFIKTELGEFNTLRDQLWWAIREWLRTDSGAMLPPDPMLLEELKTPTYEVNKKLEVMPKARMRELLRRSPDRADALGLTFAPIARPSFLRLGLQQ